jgi:hypothetical protein
VRDGKGKEVGRLPIGSSSGVVTAARLPLFFLVKARKGPSKAGKLLS